MTRTSAHDGITADDAGWLMDGWMDGRNETYSLECPPLARPNTPPVAVARLAAAAAVCSVYAVTHAVVAVMCTQVTRGRSHTTHACQRQQAFVAPVEWCCCAGNGGDAHVGDVTPGNDENRPEELGCTEPVRDRAVTSSPAHVQSMSASGDAVCGGHGREQGNYYLWAY
jgi:hypothetical protein